MAKTAEAIQEQPAAVEQPAPIVSDSPVDRFPLRGKDPEQPAHQPEPEAAAPAPEPEIQDDEFRGDEGEEEDEGQPRDEQGRFQPKNSLQTRVVELARERAAERQRADRLEQLVASQQAMLAKQLGVEPGAQQQVNPNAPPDPDKFPAGRFDPDYIQATVRYEANQLLEQRIQQVNQQQVQARLIQAEQEFAASNPDYLQAKEALLMDQAVASHLGIGEAIVNSSRPAELIYVLGMNPGLASQIARMNPIQAARQMGLIEAALEARAAQPNTERMPSAPAPSAPIKPIGGTAPASRLKAPGAGEKLSYAEHVAYMDKLEKERAKR